MAFPLMECTYGQQNGQYALKVKIHRRPAGTRRITGDKQWLTKKISRKHDAADEGQISEDDWAAAMAEQAITDDAAGRHQGAQPANIFPSFRGPGQQPAMNELDMILDIPVQITVELGAPRSPSRTCCSWPTARLSNSMPWLANRWM